MSAEIVNLYAPVSIVCGIASSFMDPLAGMCLPCLNGPVPS